MSEILALSGNNPFAVFGGSFNPPGLHHIALARFLAQRFASLRLVPCGFRNDKVRQDNDWMDSGLRRQIVDLAFRPLIVELAPLGLNIEIDYRDLETNRFSATAELAELYRQDGTPHFVVGADLVIGGATGQSAIQSQWYQGQSIWQELHWICLERPGFPLLAADLPPKCTVAVCNIEGSSSAIRQRLRQGKSIAGLVSPEIEAILLAQRAFL